MSRADSDIKTLHVTMANSDIKAWHVTRASAGLNTGGILFIELIDYTKIC
jgi:hypothetical protein